VTLDIQALSFDNLNWFKPCECGSHSFYLDDKMKWQCSRCKPYHRLDTIRFKLDDNRSAEDKVKAPH
jgi:hypothetical protein